MKKWLWLILTTFTIVGYQNCGTDTGNPAQLQNSTAPLYGTPSIVSTICSKLTKCHTDLSYGLCSSQVYALTTLGTQFGGASGTSLDSLFAAERASSVKYSSSAATSCLNAIANLSCSDSGVQGAYDSTSGVPFSGTPAMIPANVNCGSVFSY